MRYKYDLNNKVVINLPRFAEAKQAVIIGKTSLVVTSENGEGQKDFTAYNVRYGIGDIKTTRVFKETDLEVIK